MTAQPVRVPIPASDQTWLHMDRPNNLMQVRSLLWFDGEVRLEDVRRVVQERVVERYPVFRRRAVARHGSWFWEDDPAFDLDRHLTRTRLTGDETDLRDHISRRFSEPFDPTHPLWDIELVSGVEGYHTVVFARFHHALADGVRLTQLMLSLCDHTATDDLPPRVGRGGARGSRLAAGAGAVRRGVGDAVDFATGSLRLPLRAVTHLGPHMFEDGMGLVLHPGRLLDVVGTLASEDNQSVNTMIEVARMLSAPRSAAAAWSGTPGVPKAVAWAAGLDLSRVKAIGRAHDATVNDVLLAVISRALTRYLHERESVVDEIAWLVPVSLQPLDANLPEELGNHFSLVFLPMPLGIEGTAEVIAAVRARMARLKHSAEPVISFGLQWVVAESPGPLSRRITDLFANKGVGVLTNVPGPRQPMTLAGVSVAGSLGWAPTSGDQPLSLCLFSYNGAVSIGIAADAALVPDPGRIADLIAEELAAM